jgi:hypothetical protein
VMGSKSAWPMDPGHGRLTPLRQEAEGRCIFGGVGALSSLLIFGFCFCLLFKSHFPDPDKRAHGGLCEGSRVQTSYLETRPKVKSQKVKNTSGIVRGTKSQKEGSCDFVNLN